MINFFKSLLVRTSILLTIDQLDQQNLIHKNSLIFDGLQCHQARSRSEILPALFLQYFCFILSRRIYPLCHGGWLGRPHGRWNESKQREETECAKRLTLAYRHRSVFEHQSVERIRTLIATFVRSKSQGEMRPLTVNLLNAPCITIILLLMLLTFHHAKASPSPSPLSVSYYDLLSVPSNVDPIQLKRASVKYFQHTYWKAIIGAKLICLFVPRLDSIRLIWLCTSFIPYVFVMFVLSCWVIVRLLYVIIPIVMSIVSTNKPRPHKHLWS